MARTISRLEQDVSAQSIAYLSRVDVHLQSGGIHRECQTGGKQGEQPCRKCDGGKCGEPEQSARDDGHGKENESTQGSP